MKLKLEPGTYVAAISGGVDSMVLLDLLVKQAKSPESIAESKKKNSTNSSQPSALSTRLIVAHFDHGIRSDSELDRKLVQYSADRYGLQFVYDVGSLGSGASEAAARKARYEFLHRVRKAANAKAVITAHHQDDVIETAIINVTRGTGRRGMTSLKSADTVIRPLLDIPKSDILAYAKKHDIKWREDATNTDTAYLRNYIRHKIVPLMDREKRKKFILIINSLSELNKDIDIGLINHLHMQPASDKLDRHMFIMLPHAVAKEVMSAWLRHSGIRGYDKKTLERLVAAGKTLRSGGQTDVNLDYIIKADKKYITLTARYR